MRDSVNLTLPRRRPKSAAGWAWLAAGVLLAAWMAHHATHAPAKSMEILEGSFVGARR